MWKSQLNKAIKEVRFVLKQNPEHHGLWRFNETKLADLRMLNQNTFFSIAEISEEFESPSGCYLVFGDVNNTEELIESGGVSNEAFEKILKEKVAFGLTLERLKRDPSLPVSIMDSYKYVRHVHEHF